MNERIPSTGGVSETPDSVLISYDDLRIVNSKLIELKYEKDINKNLREVIKNDSILIDNYNQEVSTYRNKSIRYKTERNIAAGGGVIAVIIAILSLLK